jgi:hypothetical protein
MPKKRPKLIKWNTLSWSERLFLLLPIFLFFGYQPHIYFGSHFGMNLDLSILQIFLALFVVVSLPQIWRARRELIRSRAVWLTLPFVLICAVSLFWTLNMVRAVLTLAVILLLFAVFLSIVANKKTHKLLGAFLQMLMIAAIGASIFAWYQVVGEAVGLPAWATLLPDVYQSQVFGFARPTAFAAEPQFLASLLLAPVLLLAHSFINKEGDTRKTGLWLLFLAVTLVVTISRGALLGLALGFVVLAVINYKHVKHLAAVAGIFVLSAILALCLAGLAAQINQRNNASFYTSIQKTVDHYTLGIVKLPSQKSSSDSSGGQGYVKESTTSRLSNSGAALDIWAASGKNLVFGIGLGGTGYAYRQYYGSGTDRAIVNNEYIELLLENGLLGLASFAIILALLVWWLIRSKQLIWLAIVAAFAVQWCFFSGYPNAMHIYALLAVAYALTSLKKPAKSALKNA